MIQLPMNIARPKMIWIRGPETSIRFVHHDLSLLKVALS
jgi:hypothetical protein